MFKGILTALVTPFLKNKVDYKSLKSLVEWQLEEGVDGFVVNGTTAESPTLTPEEVVKIFKTVRKISGKNVPLLLGAGDNSTERTIKKVRAWNALGPDGYLLVTPYYNRPPQEGLYQHFSAVAKASKKPIVLYNVPTRTAVNMQTETVVRLSKQPRIVGVKEASGNLDVAAQMVAELGKSFSLLSGDDKSAVDFCGLGGHGVISVVSHVIPAQMREIVKLAGKSPDAAKARWQKYSNLNDLMGIETNPIPVKAALHLMGIIASSEMRLPLIKISPASQQKLKAELSRLEII